MDQNPPPVQTRSLAVNAAFLKDIKDDNRELKSLLDKIHPMTEHPQTAVNHWPEFIQCLADLRDQLALHFSLEEAYGYFEEAIQTAPQLSLLAQQLRSQHTALFEQIRELAEQALEVPGDSPEQATKFLHKFQFFRQAFESHEEAELKLILDAFEEDIGGGD